MMRNPVFESSMKRRMRSFRSPLLLTLYILFLLLVSGTVILTLQRSQVTLGNLRAGLETYIYLSVMQFALIVLVAPALTSAAISGERERQTLDLLLCTRVGAFRIVLGKLLSSFFFLALMIICSLPVLALTLFFGGVSIWDMLFMELFLMVTALACCSIGIFCSAAFKRTVTATVVAYLSIFALGVGTIIIPFLLQWNRLQEISELIYAFSSGNASTYSSSVMVTSAMSSITSGVSSLPGEVILQAPKLFFLNPAIGLLSLLVDHTGLMQNTLSNMLGYRGSVLFELFDAIGSVAIINMIVLVVCSVILIVLAAIFVKPGGRKVKKKQ